jgi:hypothetical protein
MLSSWWRLPAALHALTWLGVAASGNVDTCPNSRTSLASKRVDWSCTLADYATVPSEPVQDDPASLSIAAAEYLPEAETKSSNAASTAAPALVAQSTPRISSIIDDARAASSAATPIMEPPSPAYTPFLSFSEWRERQEQVLVKLQSNLKQPLPVPTAKPTSPDAPVSVSTLEGMTDEELRDRAVAQPVRYLQPLPASGSGAADDPLLPLSARTNYASVDCSAAVLRASKHSKGATSILFNAKDRYMLTPCSAGEKFVFVELCEEIDVDAIVLANYEFFSSMFKHVRVQGSEVYPGADGDWVTLGTLRAGNLRGLQASLNTDGKDGFDRSVTGLQAAQSRPLFQIFKARLPEPLRQRALLPGQHPQGVRPESDGRLPRRRGRPAERAAQRGAAGIDRSAGGGRVCHAAAARDGFEACGCDGQRADAYLRGSTSRPFGPFGARRIFAGRADHLCNDPRSNRPPKLDSSGDAA